MKKRGHMPQTDLPAWVDSLQSKGLYFFTRKEAIDTLSVSEVALKQAATRLIKKNRIVRILGGFYIIVPLEYLSTGMLPAEWFISDLMKYVEQPFYVGLLSAAFLHGAAHQQPQQFQVVTTRPLREIKSKSLAIRFFVKKRFNNTRTVQIKTQTGFIPVSTPEATALDLIRYARAIGGLDRVLTILQELGETIQSPKLIEAVRADDNLAYAQRLGWLLERAGFPGTTGELAQWIHEKNPSPARLEPSLPIRGSKKDTRWRLFLNSEVESDL
ncbi:MAG TPA: type IV toxin-antitoxin system AbiEi family antitoxin [Syntrophorhabdaceae bacterium]|jgi:predicted transcriptional regulator of viral defense system|nr:type IV toxin-antitoxin system AbiEi family antitoxin [Syntrophorhabdaceae bacterium]